MRLYLLGGAVALFLSEEFDAPYTPPATEIPGHWLANLIAAILSIFGRKPK